MSAARCGINDLADETLLKTFSYLSHKELCRSVAPVCVAWLKLSRDWSLWEEIKEAEYRGVPDNGFIAAATVSWCSHLKCIDFKERRKLTKADFETVLRNCPKLERISFERCCQVNDNVLKLFSKYCIWLKLVNLTGCGISSKAMVHFRGKPMQGFNLSTCHDTFCDVGLIFLATTFKELSMINLCDANAITIRSIIVLTTIHSKHLTEVILDGEWIDDEACWMLSRCSMMRFDEILQIQLN